MRLCESFLLSICAPRLILATRRFNMTPQRMRMIVEAFKETLELGLSKHKQVVVSPTLCFCEGSSSTR